MVKGLDRFRDYFRDFTDQYILIGGAACDISFENNNADFRATRDLDIVLIVENLNQAFGEQFWAFIREGGYQHNIYSDRGFISYKDTSKFDESFYKITHKLEILAHTKKRDDALEAGREMVRIIKEIETDDDYFPLYNIEEIRRIVDPYGDDEEMERLCDA